MDANLFVDVPFGSEDAWDSFELNHGMTHQTVYQAMLRRGIVPEYLDLFEFPQDENSDYLFFHWQVHQSNARLLGITTNIPDLSVVDLSDSQQYNDWMLVHSEVHAQENMVLGLN